MYSVIAFKLFHHEGECCLPTVTKVSPKCIMMYFNAKLSPYNLMVHSKCISPRSISEDVSFDPPITMGRQGSLVVRVLG